MGGEGGFSATVNAQTFGSLTPNTTVNASTSGTETSLSVIVSGMVRVTASGTIVPSITLGTAAAATVQAGSYLVIRRLGDDTAYTAGTWS